MSDIVAVAGPIYAHVVIAISAMLALVWVICRITGAFEAVNRERHRLRRAQEWERRWREVYRHIDPECGVEGGEDEVEARRRWQ